jgi:N utilization substance protein B
MRGVVARVARCYDRVPVGYDRAADLAERAATASAEFDARVAAAAEHWRFERTGLVERNILRLALAELSEGRTPPRVVIDEAVGLAQWFAGEKAPAFVNGILDRLAREQGRL